MLRCLQRENQHKLKWECQEDLLRQDVQNSGDMRLSISLLRMCSADKQTYCSHVEFGARLPAHHMLPRPELEHSRRPHFTASCAAPRLLDCYIVGDVELRNASNRESWKPSVMCQVTECLAVPAFSGAWPES